MSEDVFKAEVVWGWAESEHAERWNGPFGTREEAEAELLADLDEGWVSEGRYFDVGKLAAEVVDLDDIVERMNEHEEASCFDSEVFDLPEDKPGHDAAQDALAATIASWAREHVHDNGSWRCVGSPVHVKVLDKVPAPPAPEARG